MNVNKHKHCTHHAKNAHGNAACELGTEHDVPWAMASWALAGGRVEHPALLAAAQASPEYKGKVRP